MSSDRHGQQQCGPNERSTGNRVSASNRAKCQRRHRRFPIRFDLRQWFRLGRIGIGIALTRPLRPLLPRASYPIASGCALSSSNAAVLSCTPQVMRQSAAYWRPESGRPARPSPPQARGHTARATQPGSSQWICVRPCPACGTSVPFCSSARSAPRRLQPARRQACRKSRARSRSPPKPAAEGRAAEGFRAGVGKRRAVPGTARADPRILASRWSARRRSIR